LDVCRAEIFVLGVKQPTMRAADAVGTQRLFQH